MTTKETLIADVNTLSHLLEAARQRGDWDQAKEAAETLAHTYRKLHLLPPDPKPPIGFTEEQMKHILMPPPSFP